MKNNLIKHFFYGFLHNVLSGCGGMGFVELGAVTAISGIVVLAAMQTASINNQSVLSSSLTCEENYVSMQIENILLEEIACRSTFSQIKNSGKIKYIIDASGAISHRATSEGALAFSGSKGLQIEDYILNGVNAPNVRGIFALTIRFNKGSKTGTKEISKKHLDFLVSTDGDSNIVDCKSSFKLSGDNLVGLGDKDNTIISPGPMIAAPLNLSEITCDGTTVGALAYNKNDSILSGKGLYTCKDSTWKKTNIDGTITCALPLQHQYKVTKTYAKAHVINPPLAFTGFSGHNATRPSSFQYNVDDSSLTLSPADPYASLLLVMGVTFNLRRGFGAGMGNYIWGDNSAGGIGWATNTGDGDGVNYTPQKYEALSMMLNTETAPVSFFFGPKWFHFVIWWGGPIAIKDVKFTEMAIYMRNASCPAPPAPIDGNWTAWACGACNESCGNGTQGCTRSCTAPAPANGGNDCDRSQWGENLTQWCIVRKCSFGEECADDDDCDPNLACGWENLCKLKDYAGCSSGNDCASGDCSMYNQCC
ncbi:MAG: thrombospondin type-1 domain-containing protein [Oligoflexia bacterium]|nr:thrombospondin type-1 domain-containing protein [Oligoflexia bacterium]